ncbi:MGMT family protein [Leucobacter insecticola]|uniref:MGMT family protein n=1 Tax=Leucobacter insecticola TaxID=2714934 RepID=A0A6G8FHC7_9MICO|nr:MGMT family protein [Leucobacter insecticola]QIM15757.1 MGMT family protein [Leucobacter insecticola]
MFGAEIPEPERALELLKQALVRELESATEAEISAAARRLDLPVVLVKKWLPKVRLNVNETNLRVVLEALPEGMVTTYGKVAVALGRAPGAAIRVGRTLRKMAGLPELGASVMKAEWIQKDGSIVFPATETVTVVTKDGQYQEKRATLLASRGVPCAENVDGFCVIPSGHLAQ